MKFERLILQTFFSIVLISAIIVSISSPFEYYKSGLIILIFPNINQKYLTNILLSLLLFVHLTVKNVYHSENPKRQQNLLFSITLLIWIKLILLLFYSIIDYFPSFYISDTNSEASIQVYYFSGFLSSIFEELIFRGLLFLVPMKLLSNYKHGNFKLKFYSLIVLNSIMFSYGHYLSGWNSVKMIDTFITSLIFGLICYRYGLGFTIITHTTINFLLLEISFNYLYLQLFVFGFLLILVLYTMENKNEFFLFFKTLILIHKNNDIV